MDGEAARVGREAWGARTLPASFAAPGSGAVELGFADAPNRLVAFAADAVVLALASFLAACAVSVLAGPVIRFERGGTIAVDRTLALVDGLLATALGAVYFTAAWSRLSRSVGLALVGCRISATGGARLPAHRALARWALLFGPLGAAGVSTPFLPGLGDAVVDLLVLVWLGAVLVTVARSPTKQGFHDRIAGSFVTKPLPAAASWPGEAEKGRTPS